MNIKYTVNRQFLFLEALYESLPFYNIQTCEKLKEALGGSVMLREAFNWHGLCPPVPIKDLCKSTLINIIL